MALGLVTVWRPPSLHEILLIPYDVHLLFLLFTCFFWKILSCLNQIRAHLQTSKWSASYVRCSTENGAMETSLSPWMRTSWDYTLCSWELCLFETGEFRERLHAQSAQFNSLRLWNFRKLWDRCNPGVNFANVKLVHNNLVCNLWILLARHE